MEGSSCVFLAVDGRVAGAVILDDPIRPDTPRVIRTLRRAGIKRVVMVTGDHPDVAESVGIAIGVDRILSERDPADKVDAVTAERESGVTIMVGDGVNDAPALAAADVGVAMGAAGSDAALETADVALMSDELLKIPYVLRLARATLRNVKTNVAISLALKAVFLVMAVTGSATLWMAVLADSGASVIVVGNALRLLRSR
jgi:Cd2+/Zn2+-exporting ATPase